MGSPKALLPIRGKSFIENVIQGLEASKVGKIFVVLGYNPDAIRQKIRDLDVTTLFNADYSQGQLSSLVTALKHIQTAEPAASIDAVLVHLVDHPFINTALVDQMVDQFYASKKLIVVPTYHGKRGHPVIFSKELFQEFLDAPLDQGAKPVVHAHRAETLEIPTDDQGIVIDLDTPEEYRNHLGESEWPNSN
ncbi:MAG: NTP transferase domain-containing protein [Deltaproteobacteria bacterium]|nr:NTP transferase domain-containing protein [Deltaproteobacteria bacterium]